EADALALVLRVAGRLNEGWVHGIDVARGADAPVYGDGSALDSMGLVAFVIAVEQEVGDEWGRIVTLADERAMSLNYNPFRTAGDAARYLAARLNDEVAPA